MSQSARQAAARRVRAFLVGLAVAGMAAAGGPALTASAQSPSPSPAGHYTKIHARHEFDTRSPAPAAPARPQQVVMPHPARPPAAHSGPARPSPATAAHWAPLAW